MVDRLSAVPVAKDSVKAELVSLRLQLLEIRTSASHSSQSRADLRRRVARLLTGNVFSG